MRQVADVLTEQFEVAPFELEPDQRRVPLLTLYEHLADAAASAGRPIGFDVARALTVAAFEELGFLVRSCQTLGDGIEVALRYMRTLSDERLEMERHDDVVSLRHHPSGPAHPGHRSASELMLGDLLFGLPPAEHVPAVDEVRLELRGSPVASEETYRRAAGVHVVFAAPVDRVVMPASLLALPMPRADPDLAALMESRVEAQARALPAEDDLVARTEAAIRGLLAAGHVPTLADAARRLGTSERSLHRGLNRHAQRFGAVLDRVRALEDERLRAQGRAAADIAGALGFSSTNAYYRARARWNA